MHVYFTCVYCSCTLNMVDMARDPPLACTSVLCVWSSVRLDNSQVRYKRHHLTLSGRDDHKASISASTFVPALPSSPAFFQLHIDNIIATVGPGATTGHSLIYVTIQHLNIKFCGTSLAILMETWSNHLQKQINCTNLRQSDLILTIRIATGNTHGC